MYCAGCVLGWIAAMALSGIAGAQTAPAPAKGEAALGLRLSPVPEVLSAHLPKLDPGQGVVVTDVKPASRAAALGLRRHDVIVSVGSHPVTSGDDLLERLSALQPGDRESLQIVRGGRGTSLSLAHVNNQATETDPAMPKSLLKAGGPPAVTVEMKPLSPGRIEASFVYLNAANKMERLTLRGSLDEIDRQLE